LQSAATKKERKKEKNAQKTRETAKRKLVATDYGHTKAKSLILCGPNSNPIPNSYLGCGNKGIVFFVKIMVK
jgi:hypothetical protein